MTRRRFVATIGASISIAMTIGLAGAWADKGRGRGRDGDHDDAWEHSQSGDTLSLSEVLQIVRPQIDGQIIEIEYEFEDGRPMYEFKYINPAGRVREMYVDARTGAIIRDELD